MKLTDLWDKIPIEINIWKIAGTIVPVIASVFTAVLWVDTRYMHKDMATMHHTEIQLIVYTRAMKFYEKRIDKEGHTPTATEKREYEILVDTVTDLTKKRNEGLGLQ